MFKAGLEITEKEEERNRGEEEKEEGEAEAVGSIRNHSFLTSRDYCGS